MKRDIMFEMAVVETLGEKAYDLLAMITAIKEAAHEKAPELTDEYINKVINDTLNSTKKAYDITRKISRGTREDKIEALAELPPEAVGPTIKEFPDLFKDLF